MSKKILLPKGAAPPLAPYSHGVIAGNIVYLSGMLSMDSDGRTVGAGDVATQTHHILETIGAVLEEAGCDFDDIVFNAIFLKDLADYKAMNEVYAKFFPTKPPARYCIQAALVRPEFLVEIASTAHLPS